MQRFGERIRNRREGLIIKINTLANLIGVTPGLISQTESLKGSPSIMTRKKVTDALQTTIGAFQYGNINALLQLDVNKPNPLFKNNKT